MLPATAVRAPGSALRSLLSIPVYHISRRIRCAQTLRRRGEPPPRRLFALGVKTLGPLGKGVGVRRQVRGPYHGLSRAATWGKYTRAQKRRGKRHTKTK